MQVSTAPGRENRGPLRGAGDFPGIAQTLDMFNWAHGQQGAMPACQQVERHKAECYVNSVKIWPPFR
jgi:hypothetical protein